LDELIPRTLLEIRNIWNEDNSFNMPIILAAGGITTGADIVRYLKLGAEGVVMVITKFS